MTIMNSAPSFQSTLNCSSVSYHIVNGISSLIIIGIYYFTHFSQNFTYLHNFS